MTDPLSDYRRQAKRLRRAYTTGTPEALARVEAALGRQSEQLVHAEALHVIAREAGYVSWPRLKIATELRVMTDEQRLKRLKLALFEGQQGVVERLLAEAPDLGQADMGVAAALYDVGEVARRLASDRKAALEEVDQRRPLLHLAFSKHFQGAGSREAMMATAELLLDAGADVNDYFLFQGDPNARLSALYGAIGHGNNMALGAWFLSHGADPNDNESLYHATELGHTRGLELLLSHGATPHGTNALLRAIDFDDRAAIGMLLDHGADPNEGVAAHPSGAPPVVLTAMHQVARRQASAETAEMLLAAGASETEGAYATARIFGNRPVAEVLAKAGWSTDLTAEEALLARAADGQVTGRITPARLTPEQRLLPHRLAGFGSVRHMMRLVAGGLDPNVLDEMGMPAIHVFGWEGLADGVAFLLDFSPDLAHENHYGGDLLGTIIHGAEFCPARDDRDHLACARLALEAGAVLRWDEIRMTGVEDMADLLADWAEAHPGRVTGRADLK